MTIMKELHQEHVNLKRLLEMLSRKVDKFRAGTRPDFQLMSDVVSYVGGYADTHHHPREDRMFAYFKGRGTELDALMKRCEAEHAELKHLSTHLNESIDGVLHDATVVPMDVMIDSLAEFVERESEHLDFEEGDLFPKIESVASDEDWNALAQNLPSPTDGDPLFGQKLSKEYRDLYQALANERG